MTNNEQARAYGYRDADEMRQAVQDDTPDRVQVTADSKLHVQESPYTGNLVLYVQAWVEARPKA